MEINDKLKILSSAAKYDVACTSSGVKREGKKGSIGNTSLCGICHSFSSDGRCVSLLKILFTNFCSYDCQYCVNRKSNDVERAMFTPEEIAEITMNFYRRNYIEGLFLSSAVFKNPDYTMELLYKTLFILRNTYKFNGYIHVKAIPSADEELIRRTGFLADRMSVNIELPSSESLKLLAPDKSKDAIFKPMKALRNSIQENKNDIVVYKNAPKFAPAGQSTQMIVGATPDNDRKIINLAEGLYNKFKLKRVFYSAYIPVTENNKLLPVTKPPMLREHRLYQADWLLRYYGFNAEEILGEKENLDLGLDPKCQWAIRNIHLFPIEINKADIEMLLRIPGIGVKSAYKIISARRVGRLNFDNLRKLNVVLKRAKYFITCDGKMMANYGMEQEILTKRLCEKDKMYEQLNF